MLACGIDPNKSLLFVQSHVPAHAELAWILNCVTPVGWLERMTQYKDKSAKQESVSTGLLDYPVLQAADIVLYQTDYVPVGEDQRQHIELTRDVVQRFHHLYGETFAMPDGMIPKVGAKIMGFDDPTAKMSKSTAADATVSCGRAVGYAGPDLGVLKRATTDSGKEIVFSDDPQKAGVNNLLTVYQAFTGQSRAEIEAHFGGKLYGGLKREVADVIIEMLATDSGTLPAVCARPGDAGPNSQRWGRARDGTFRADAAACEGCGGVGAVKRLTESGEMNVGESEVTTNCYSKRLYEERQPRGIALTRAECNTPFASTNA